MKPLRTVRRQGKNKKVIYHWSGRGATAPLAAALHLGLVVPDLENFSLKNIPFARGITGKDTGTLIYLGRGETGEEVYLLAARARGKKGKLLLTVIRETARLLGEDPDTYFFVDCEKYKRKGKKEELVMAIKEMVMKVKKEPAPEP